MTRKRMVAVPAPRQLNYNIIALLAFCAALWVLVYEVAKAAQHFLF